VRRRPADQQQRRHGEYAFFRFSRARVNSNHAAAARARMTPHACATRTPAPAKEPARSHASISPPATIGSRTPNSMTRVAADPGSMESSDGSVREVAAQMPAVRIRIQNGRGTDDIAVNATTPNPPETTSTITAAARQAAPSVRASSVRRLPALKPTSTPKAASATGTTGSSKLSVTGDSRLMPWVPTAIPAMRRRPTGAEVADHTTSPRHRRDRRPSTPGDGTRPWSP
jgi:hypothetical protein